MQKIIIALIILCFVPIAIFAISPKVIATNPSIEFAFAEVKQQANTSGFLTSMINGSTCNSL